MSDTRDSEDRRGPGGDPPIDRAVDSVQSAADFLQDSEKWFPGLADLEAEGDRVKEFCRCIHCVEYEV